MALEYEMDEKKHNRNMTLLMTQQRTTPGSSNVRNLTPLKVTEFLGDRGVFTADSAFVMKFSTNLISAYQKKHGRNPPQKVNHNKQTYNAYTMDDLSLMDSVLNEMKQNK